jgi:hypothetical protein
MIIVLSRVPDAVLSFKTARRHAYAKAELELPEGILGDQLDYNALMALVRNKFAEMRAA